MIFGLGCDIVDIERMKNTLVNAGAGFVERILCDAERLVFDEKLSKNEHLGVAYLAKRFAAKEAFSKAMGCGIGHAFSFQDLAVLNEENGAPQLEYSSRLHLWLTERKLRAKISLSDEHRFAMATVILWTHS